MTHRIPSVFEQAEEFEGWPGVFRPLQHHVPSGARRLLLADGSRVVFAVCGSPCTPPTGAWTGLPWCADCRRHLDTLTSHGNPDPTQ